MLPVNFLRQLIGLYGNSIQGMVPQYLESAMDEFQTNHSAIRDSFRRNCACRHRQAQHGDVRRGQQSLHAGKKAEAQKVREDEVEKLRAELAALQAKVDRLDR